MVFSDPCHRGPGLHPSWWGLRPCLSLRSVDSFASHFPEHRESGQRQPQLQPGPGPNTWAQSADTLQAIIISWSSWSSPAWPSWSWWSGSICQWLYIIENMQSDALQRSDVITGTTAECGQCTCAAVAWCVVLINSCDYILMVTLRLPPTEIIRRCYAIMSRDKAIIFCRLTSCCFRVMSRTLSLSSAFSGMILLSLAPRQPRLSSLMMMSLRSSHPIHSRPAPALIATRS